jgi:hypothetical protein
VKFEKDGPDDRFIAILPVSTKQKNAKFGFQSFAKQKEPVGDSGESRVCISVRKGEGGSETAL